MYAKIPIIISVAVVLSAAAGAVPIGKITVADCENADARDEEPSTETLSEPRNPFENFSRLMRSKRATKAGLCEE